MGVASGHRGMANEARLHVCATPAIAKISGRHRQRQEQKVAGSLLAAGALRAPLPSSCSAWRVPRGRAPEPLVQQNGHVCSWQPAPALPPLLLLAPSMDSRAAPASERGRHKEPEQTAIVRGMPTGEQARSTGARQPPALPKALREFFRPQINSSSFRVLSLTSSSSAAAAAAAARRRRRLLLLMQIQPPPRTNSLGGGRNTDYLAQADPISTQRYSFPC